MRYALITGGSRGIGKAISLRLADEYPILINYKSNRAAAETTLSAIESKGGKAELLPFDVADGSAADAALTQWQDAHPEDTISVLVNNAGIRIDTMMVFMQASQWHSVLDTTLNGFFYVTRRLLKDMLMNRSGRIINISSISGLKGQPGQTNYSAAKAALIGASKALALEVAARKVTVNVIAPGFIETDMTEGLDEQSIKKLIPAGRFGTAEEVAALAAFLASDNAAYITGEVISINGGLYT
ncbi:MAG: 3-oxoacyl-ACP reductase FabG [Tannerellaceae bacterium]|jgi:3-oxoacyl-[acyl-carrier protein] reductase|nr:3-oxoacyl-ACP reductase FabG [Tannerellaceae bacterium]